MKIFSALLIVAASLVLASCESINNEDVGVVTGGVIGGVLGNQVGHGNGRVAATVVGAVAGGFLGGQVGASMDKVDKQQMYKTLESTPTNKTKAWRNPDNGNSYRVTPTETYNNQGTPCRRYTIDAKVDGKPEKIYGTACRDSSGHWHTVS